MIGFYTRTISFPYKSKDPSLLGSGDGPLRTPMNSRIWIAVFIGSTVGGCVPALWGGEMLSYAGVLFSGVGAFAGLWAANKMR